MGRNGKMKLSDLEMRTLSVPNIEKKFYLVYARKSSESEDRQVESINDQLKVLYNVSESQNLHTVLKPFSESRSAKSPGRPEFNKMLDEINRRGDIKGIIVWKLNRLFRNPEDEGKIRQMLSDGRLLEIVTPSGAYNESDSDFTMAVEGAQAQRFIRDLREDTARGVKNKIDKGIAPILAPPGYINDITKRQGEKDIIPHPTQFTLVRQLFETYMTGNYSVQALHSKAEEMGIKSNRGKIVSRTQLYEMLRNPFYTGMRFTYAGQLYTNGVHKRMLLDEEFDHIQDILAGRTHPRGQIHTDLLTGLMRCGECNMSITSEVKTKNYKNGKSQTFVYYRCTKKKNGTKCSQPYVNAIELERQVIEYLDGLQLSPKIVEWAIKWLNELHKTQADVRIAKYKHVEHAYEETLRKLDKIVDLVLSGMLSVDEGKNKKAELELEKKKLSEQLEKIDTHADTWNTLTIDTFDFVKNIKERFANGTIEQRKTILRTIGSNLIIKNKKLIIEVRKPFEIIRNVVSEFDEDVLARTPKLPAISSQKAFSGPSINVVGG